MKKWYVTTGILAFLLLISLSTCSSNSAQVDRLKGDLSGLEAELSSDQHEISNLKKGLAQLQESYDSLKAEENSLIERMMKTSLQNPTWAELEAFVKRDNTDTLTYEKDKFDCQGFALTLRDNAWRYGFRSAYVGIGYGGGVGHALNAFQTIDSGLIYIDNTQSDNLGYIEVGKPYALICLEGVKSTFIDCSGDPTKFWSPLTYATHPKIFSYDYYTNYASRRQFLSATIDSYNQAVAKYNTGGGSWTDSQMETWFNNIQALNKDVGLTSYKLGDIVQNVEIYWN